MTISIGQLQRMLDRESLRYLVDPKGGERLVLPMRSPFGTYQVYVLVEVEGKFMQFRSAGLLHCRQDNPHLKEVLKILAEVNYETRLLKLGWDPSDGEIVAYADIWLMDAQLTQEQLHRMLGNYMPALDLAYARIQETLETGRDPGSKDPRDIVAAIARSGSVPDSLRDKLASLLGGSDEGDESEASDEVLEV